MLGIFGKQNSLRRFRISFEARRTRAYLESRPNLGATSGCKPAKTSVSEASKPGPVFAPHVRVPLLNGADFACHFIMLFNDLGTPAVFVGQFLVGDVHRLTMVWTIVD